MGSLEDAIDEEPERFAKYLSIDKIAKSKDPQKEFKKQLRKAFGSSVTGVNLWKHLKGKYSLQNKIWKASNIQKRLPKEFRGSYKRAKFRALKNKFMGRNKRLKDSGIYALNKSVSITEPYERLIKTITEAGETIIKQTVSAYNRTKSRKFTDSEIDFLKRRSGESPSETRRILNKTFQTSRSYDSIKTKMLRLSGRKKT